MHEAQAAKAIRRHARALKIGKLYPARIADHNIFNIAFAVNERANLPAGFMGKLGQVSGKLRRHNLVRRDATRVKFFDAAQLVRFESLRIAVYVADLISPLKNARPNKASARAAANKFIIDVLINYKKSGASGVCLSLCGKPFCRSANSVRVVA